MYKKYIKRVIDILFSLLLIVLTSPVLVTFSIIIKISDPSEPIFFIQQRPGKNERIFNIYKFRTMSTQLKDEDGNYFSDTERLTTLGKLLRKTSIDEIPQFFNVLKGDMSFIGPRPLLVQYLKHYNEEQKIRHTVRPGISGWAQVNGRNAIDWETKFKYDVWYANNCSMKIDIIILYRTILNIVKRKDINSSKEVIMSYFGE